MLKSGKSKHFGDFECSCCSSKQERRITAKQNKRVEERAWKKEFGVAS